MNITYEVNKDNLEFCKDFDGIHMQVAGVNLNTRKMFILKNESYFDRLEFTDLVLFEKELNTKFGTAFNVELLITHAMNERIKIIEDDNTEQKITHEALIRGKRLTETQISKLLWHVQKDVGGYAEEGNAGYICDIANTEFYIFNLSNLDQRKIYLILKKDMMETTWCRCKYLGDDHKYVECYKGVDHGWICPKCKRFHQIG